MDAVLLVELVMSLAFISYPMCCQMRHYLDDVEGLVDGALVSKENLASTSVETLAGDDLEDLLAELDQETVEVCSTCCVRYLFPMLLAVLAQRHRSAWRTRASWRQPG